MSRQTTKLFFDEELNSQLLEGGAKSGSSLSNSKDSSLRRKKTKGVDAAVPVPDEDQAGFIKKTFGLFSVMILFQLVYILIIAQEPKKCVKQGSEEVCKSKEGGMREMAAQMVLLATGIVLSIISTAIMVCSKSQKKDVNVGVGYGCWLIFTIGMTLVAGYIAARMDATKILAAEITTLVTTLICTFFGGKFLKQTKGDKKMKKMGPTVAVLGLVLATVMITCMALGIAGLANKLILSVAMVFIMCFFMMDIQFIVEGKYGVFTKDDYVLASMKLFADFILIFSILMTLFE